MQCRGKQLHGSIFSCPPSCTPFWRPLSLHQFWEPGHQSCFVLPCAGKLKQWRMLKEVKYIKEEGKNFKGKQDQHDNEKSDIIGVIIKSFISGGKRIWCCSFKIEAFILKLVSLLPLWVLCGSQYLCHINYFEYPVQFSCICIRSCVQNDVASVM